MNLYNNLIESFTSLISFHRDQGAKNYFHSFLFALILAVFIAVVGYAFLLLVDFLDLTAESPSYEMDSPLSLILPQTSRGSIYDIVSLTEHFFFALLGIHLWRTQLRLGTFTIGSFFSDFGNLITTKSVLLFLGIFGWFIAAYCFAYWINSNLTTSAVTNTLFSLMDLIGYLITIYMGFILLKEAMKVSFDLPIDRFKVFTVLVITNICISGLSRFAITYIAVFGSKLIAAPFAEPFIPILLGACLTFFVQAFFVKLFAYQFVSCFATSEAKPEDLSDNDLLDQ